MAPTPGVSVPKATAVPLAAPTGDEIIERLVQAARDAINARAPRPAAPPPPPGPPTQLAKEPPPRAAPARAPHDATSPAAPLAPSATPNVTLETIDPPARRRRPPWGWIAAGVAVPVAIWCLFNARDTDDSVSGEVAVESTTSTTTTTAAPAGTVAVASVPPGVATTVPPPSPDPTLVQRCVEFAQFAAYIGDPEMAAFWTAAGLNVDVLLANCAALPPEELDRLSRRKTDMDLFMNGGVVTTAETVPATPPASAPQP